VQIDPNRLALVARVLSHPSRCLFFAAISSPEPPATRSVSISPRSERYVTCPCSPIPQFVETVLLDVVLANNTL
jgi:hypothetical protein